MADFHLGDRIEIVKLRETAIIIDLLDYEGGNKGFVGILLDQDKKICRVEARACKIFVGNIPTDEPEHYNRHTEDRLKEMV